MTHILVDTTNMFFRAKHVVRGEDLDTKVGMAMHIMFASVNKVWRDFEGKHVVFCFEGHSWRKQEYEPYKRNRKEKREALTVKEKQEEEYFFEKFGEFQSFLAKRTNCSVLRHENCEADDMIARWIQLHPDVDHVIVSSDSDFYQLLNNNVKIYNGITDTTITMEGYYNGKGKPVIDKKTGQPKEAPNPEWLLFEKCMRGDTSDNIFSAYPGVRTKGTKNKVGLLEAFDDRDKQGYSGTILCFSGGRIITEKNTECWMTTNETGSSLIFVNNPSKLKMLWMRLSLRLFNRKKYPKSAYIL